MWKYWAFGLNILSDVELSELPHARFEEADVTIRCRTLTPEDFADADARGNGGDLVVALLPDVTKFSAERGREIILDPYPGADPDSLQTFVLGTLMAIVMRQRGHLVLHASAVSKGGRAIAFVGNSGWGKSTTAAFFQRNGYAFLNDDVTTLHHRDDAFYVIPGHARVRHRAHTASWMSGGATAGVPAGTDGRYIESLEASFSREPIRLARLYLLENRVAKTTEVAELPAAAALLELLKHNRVTSVVIDPEYRARHLEETRQLVEEVPVRLLRRVRDFDALPELLRAVEADLG